MTYDYITSRKRPPVALSELIEEVQTLSDQCNAKMSSRVAFYAKLRSIEMKVAGDLAA